MAKFEARCRVEGKVTLRVDREGIVTLGVDTDEKVIVLFCIQPVAHFPSLWLCFLKPINASAVYRVAGIVGVQGTASTTAVSLNEVGIRNSAVFPDPEIHISTEIIRLAGN